MEENEPYMSTHFMRNITDWMNILFLFKNKN